MAVFKPADEEPDAALNPRRVNGVGGGGGTPLLSPLPPGCGAGDGGEPHTDQPRAGILPGEGAVREVAAFLLDRGLAGVPPTALVDLEERVVGAGAGGVGGAAASSPAPSPAAVVRVRRGSLQAYVPHFADAEEVGVSAFPVAAVHAIAALDVRLANGDRNASNVLVCRGEGGGEGAMGGGDSPVPVRLVPIDHAFTLPATLGDVALEWRHWPQARLPLDAGVAAAVAGLDAEADLVTLAGAGLALRRPCATTLRVCTAFLKACAARRLAPAAMAAAMMRGGGEGDDGNDDDQEPSALEGLVAEARARAGAAGGGEGEGGDDDDGDAALLAALGPVLEAYLDGVGGGGEEGVPAGQF